LSVFFSLLQVLQDFRLFLRPEAIDINLVGIF